MSVNITKKFNEAQRRYQTFIAEPNLYNASKLSGACDVLAEAADDLVAELEDGNGDEEE